MAILSVSTAELKKTTGHKIFDYIVKRPADAREEICVISHKPEAE